MGAKFVADGFLGSPSYASPYRMLWAVLTGRRTSTLIRLVYKPNVFGMSFSLMKLFKPHTIPSLLADLCEL
ncbi:hypothetical protein HZ326_3964 [Fusarium oxysporum f. sp. albedinis]|nr:hypothetical protein HZ326_3964 [Fusarium oxysporum f. sp. albedinis]